MTTATHETFWWLLALLGAVVVLFAVLTWLRLAAEANRERRTRERREDAASEPRPTVRRR